MSEAAAASTLAHPLAAPAPKLPLRSAWIFSPAIDLSVFLGSALFSLALLFAGPLFGLELGSASAVGATSAGADSPLWTWILAVLLVDVAHVWSTTFVVYLDPAEWRRRPALYAGAPLGAWLAGIALYQLGGEALFWRALAYLAAFHFVRQQYGWVMMARGRAGERDRFGRWLDGATIYATTLVPLILWHTQLPRAFWWMREGDFAAGLPALLGQLALACYAALGVAYVARAFRSALRARRLARATGETAVIPWSKHLVVVTSAACWYLGIVATNSDYAFTVTNVFIHGIPYAALVFLYARGAAEQPQSSSGLAARIVRRGALPFLATLWAIAYLEELLWDRAIWREHEALFGFIDLGRLGDLDGLRALAPWLVPLLAVPQLTHYFLDGFLWRRAANPRLGEILGGKERSPHV